MEDEVCKYFKYGYCKYRDNCRRHHNKEICEDGLSCKASKVCPKRHPKLCIKLASEGFCRHGETCSYRHDTRSSTKIQNYVNLMKVKLENLEKVVQEMADQIVILQSEVSSRKEAVLETNLMSFKNNNDNHTLETNDENKKDQFPEYVQLNCDLCSYTCKKKATMAKHKNTKHIEQMWTCKQCHKKFERSLDLQSHIAQEHDYDTEKIQNSSTPSKDLHNSSFVFSESMLDEFIDRDI